MFAVLNEFPSSVFMLIAGNLYPFFMLSWEKAKKKTEERKVLTKRYVYIGS
jgi:hypothetical protein